MVLYFERSKNPNILYIAQKLAHFFSQMLSIFIILLLLIVVLEVFMLIIGTVLHLTSLYINHKFFLLRLQKSYTFQKLTCLYLEEVLKKVNKLPRNEYIEISFFATNLLCIPQLSEQSGIQ